MNKPKGKIQPKIIEEEYKPISRPETFNINKNKLIKLKTYTDFLYSRGKLFVDLVTKYQ